MDNYTRMILTVIAACLVWLCFDSVPPARAGGDLTAVVLKSHDLRSWNPLPVEVKNPCKLACGNCRETK
ncbi:MAG: hypothetical protein VCA74_09840 [Deltaproteobacteria bacterium]